ncbi:MAG: hypothetical protein CMH69_07010 [Nitratireductor sp.]|nr:hypothetical protein [Nitratireductor sp.]
MIGIELAAGNDGRSIVSILTLFPSAHQLRHHLPLAERKLPLQTLGSHHESHDDPGVEFAR